MAVWLVAYQEKDCSSAQQKSQYLVVSHTANIPQTPKIIEDPESPIKCLLGGLIRGSPDPHNLSSQGAEVFLGGYY